MPSPTLIWFRQDLRLLDNPALFHAVERGDHIIPVFILDDETAGNRKMGAAARLFLHHALHALNKDLGGHLQIYRGRADHIIPALMDHYNAQNVHWNRCYEPWIIARDTRIKDILGDKAKSFNGLLIVEPWQVMNGSGEHYKVFTPFYKACQKAGFLDFIPLPRPQSMAYHSQSAPDEALHIDDLALLPNHPWQQSIEKTWKNRAGFGESAAWMQFEHFIKTGLPHYKDGRDRPDQDYVSYLSPYLQCGAISARSIVHHIQNHAAAHGLEMDGEKFIAEIFWREFSYNLLYHYPNLHDTPLQARFYDFPWVQDYTDSLKAWKTGRTGYPIVDAAMRQLWQEGWMHNRARMIVGSFLVKHLRIHWHHGEEWFWDCLTDADPANNTASWQWIAGCGADAAPYFRIFNPIIQSQKFDPNGDYIRKYVPELYNLPNRYLHTPWEAPANLLNQCGIILGQHYPHPIVNHEEARQAALDAFDSLKDLSL